MRTKPEGQPSGEGAPGERHRLFFALWPGEQVREGIAAAAEVLRNAHSPRGRWIGRHRYHLTLRFLGDVDRRRDDVIDAARHAARDARVAAFDLALDIAGSFGNRNVPWWLGCVHPPAALHALWASLGDALASAGLPLESGKPLVPHVTVLRDAPLPLPPAPIAAVHWPVRDFVLVHSVLGRQSAYHLLGQWPLPTPGASDAQP